jgi:hypothetical protein
MQDDYAHSQRSPVVALVTIPAHLVDWLRQAAYTEIGLTAETLDTAAFSTNREAHPEWFRGPTETLRDIYALLDIIGWTKTTPPNGLQINPGENSWTVIRILTKHSKSPTKKQTKPPKAPTHTPSPAPSPRPTRRASAQTRSGTS